MENTSNTTGTHTHTKTFQPSEIKTLIQNQGKATFGNQEFVLKSPAWTDANLGEIIKDPSFSVKTSSATTANGGCEYELNSNGKTVKISVDCKKHN